jgi:putative transposase
VEDDVKQQRILAVQRFLNGESPQAICTSLGRSTVWLYKWVKRHAEDGCSWSDSRSTRPLTAASRTAAEVEEIVKMVRLSLYNRGDFCGAQAIHWELEDLGVTPLPSIRTINRILSRHELTHRRTGKYEAKGTPYPVLPSLLPNQTHQADFVGPCYLKGPVRFYSLNVVDLATGRCGLHSSSSKAGQDVIDALWEVWKRVGMPENLQIDNAMSFFGSPANPRGMGPLIRLCLHNGVEPGSFHFTNLGEMEWWKSSMTTISRGFSIGSKWRRRRTSRRRVWPSSIGTTAVTAIASWAGKLR